MTAATILNISIFLKTVGVKDGNIALSEESVALIIIWVAFLIYIITTIREKNPLFGLVLSWVAYAIYNR